MKRMLWIILALALLLTLCCGAATADDMPWAGSGTESDPWLITSKLEMVYLHSYMVNKQPTAGKYWRLENDIDAAKITTLVPGNLVTLSDLSDGGDSFDGTFDGNGHIITNLRISSDENYASLFGRIGASGVVKNLNVSGNVSGARYVGGIAGECLGTIQNCAFAGNVTSAWIPNRYSNNTNTYVGGIVGYDGVSTLVSGCTVSGTISGFSCIGGIVGEGRGVYENCTFSGTVSGIYDYSAGIMGFTMRTTVIKGCKVVQSNISGSEYVGGIAGDSSAQIKQCSFSGNVSGVANIGGIAGSCDDVWKNKYIIGCNVTGHVYGTLKVGGIAGKFNYGVVEDCHFSGTVDGTSVGQYTSLDYRNEVMSSVVGATSTFAPHEGDNIGGIIGMGLPNTTLKDCEAEGSVIGRQLVGGIVGYVEELVVTDCINRCNVSGVQEVGGIVGITDSTVTGCVNRGKVEGSQINIGGITGVSCAAVTGCENYGEVSGTDVAGGIVGNAMSGCSVSNCKNHGSVIGGGAASIVSYCSITDITNCLNDGSVSGDLSGLYIGKSTVGRPIVLWANDGTQDNRFAFLNTEPVTAPECPFTREGISMLAWSTAADGSGAMYLPGEDISGLAGNSSLYAYWMNTDNVSYTDADGITHRVEAGLLNSDLTFLPGGCYFTPDSLTLNNRVTAQGDVILVLLNDTSVVAAKGIGVPQGSSLSICRGYQDVWYGNSAGILTATGDSFGAAGIGGDFGESSGTITINGGTVNATGGNAGAGIGGGNGGSGGTVTINGGTVTATGTAGTTAGTGAAGIGGGNGGSGGTVTINGGKVTATGSILSAGIGGGNGGSGGTVTISGGSVTAAGGNAGAGIGGGSKGSGGTVLINGGTVIATGNAGAAGIGGGDGGSGGSVTVHGGDVTANGSTYIGETGIDSAGIGGGRGGDGGSFTMTGGRVVAAAGGGATYGSLRANAIGANLQYSPGSIDLGPELEAWTYDEFGGTVHADYDGRAETCRASFVTIEPCAKHFYDNGWCRRCDAAVTLSIYFDGSGTESNPYQIWDMVDWRRLAEVQNEGRFRNGTGIWFQLKRDFTVDSRWLMGTSDYPFKSNFDGAGHTLTVNLTAASGAKGLFTYVSGANFTHLRIAGTITTNVADTGGLVGYASGGCTITDCVSDVDIVANGGNGHAGFVGSFEGDMAIKGSVFTGSIVGANSSYCAGFAGSGGGTVDDSIYDGLINGKANNNTFLRQKDRAGNCYYTNTDGIQRVKGKKGWSVTADEDVTINFGTPKATYPTSGITAYNTGLMYNGVFYAGPNESVPLSLSTAQAGGLFYPSAGRLTRTDSGWTLTMPAENVVIGITVFGPAAFTMPTALTTVEESAFEGMTAMTVVDASHCTTVGKWAFKGCTGLTELKLPKNCTIDADAFTGCGTVYIFAPGGGSTEAYCNAHENCVFVEE